MKTPKFVTVKWICFREEDFSPVHNWRTELKDLYKKPSKKKQSVFDYWKSKLFYIYWLTWNLYTFQIYWCIRGEDWIIRDVKITPSYNFIEKS